MSRPNKHSEIQKLLKTAVNRLMDACDSGDDPTEAVTKVARDLSLTPPLIEHVARGYNISRQNTQREAGDNPGVKCAEFPLADASQVIERLYPSKAASVGGQLKLTDHETVSADWIASLGQLETKRANQRKAHAKLAEAAAKPDVEERPSLSMLQAAQKVQQAVVDECRIKHASLVNKLQYLVGELTGYFRKTASLDLNVVRYHAERAYGADAGAVLDKVGELTKCATVRDYAKLNSRDIMEPAILTQAPYSTLKQAIEVENERRKVAAAGEVDLRLLFRIGHDIQTYALRPPVPERNLATLHWSDERLKEAEAESSVENKTKKTNPFATFLGGAATLTKPVVSLGGQAADVAYKGLAAPTAYQTVRKVTEPDNDAAMMSQLRNLEDPGVEEEIRKARVQAMVFDFLANDDVIGKYPPPVVLKTINDLAEAGPASVTNTGYMRALTRQHLLGNAQPFDYQQVIKTDQDLKHKPQQQLAAAPARKK